MNVFYGPYATQEGASVKGASVDFDVLIRGGQVISGERDAKSVRTDVGIRGEQVVVVDNLEDASAERVIDARGKVVAPGFIDVHIHSEIALLQERHRYAGLRQGVTTQLAAPDGFGWAPLTGRARQELWDTIAFSTGLDDMGIDTSSIDGYLDSFTGRIPANLVPQVPHCAVRLEAVGWEVRPATRDELEHMKRRVADWMEAGAVSLCLGLDYQPSAFSTTDELVELSKVAAAHGGIYAAHMRYNSLGREGAWLETLEIARRADIPVHVSHEYVDDLSDAVLRGGDDVSFESYLYPAGCSHLAMVLPIWAQQGGAPGLRERLKDWAFRFEMKNYLQRYFELAHAAGERFVFVDTPSGRYVGFEFAEAARQEGLSPAEFALKVLDEEYPYATMIFDRSALRGDWAATIKRTLGHPAMMVASDGVYTSEQGHPRGYACFARVLEWCARDPKLLPLPEVIYKMSGFPAERFRIKNRGFLRPGMAADVVIFDPETVAARATWEQPCLEPEGISLVMVNGAVVIEDARPTGKLPGKVIR